MDVAGLVPHEPPMRLVERLEHVDGETAVVSACLPPDCLLAGPNGTLDPVLYPELVAQAYAAFKGYQLAASGAPAREGYLVGIRKLTVTAPVRCGELLHIAVATVGALDGFAVVDGTVSCNGTTVASARLKLYVPEDGVPLP
jgi:predicted hotdog family 3-hydroxylacyl-ACP dehydratase